jgi:triphosphatase
VVTFDPFRSDVEVEWQLDAIDLRPVERWFAARSAGTTPAIGAIGRDGAPAADGQWEQTGETPLLASVPGLQAVQKPAKRLLDSYFDTSDWRLLRAGYVLRTRLSGGRLEATLKDLAPATQGLRRRLEVNERLASGSLAEIGSDGPVGRRLHALVGVRPLVQVQEVRTRRRLYSLEVRGAAVGEVALDDTSIVAGEERHRIRLQRVEVEVHAAWVEALSQFVERLRLDCGLQPATLSKFEAGLLGAGVVVPRPSDLGPTSISSTSTLADVAFAVLRRDAGVMLAHEPGTRLGEDIEALHQMRVATRRMRAALRLFETVLPARAAHVHEELGWLAGVLGAVRDLDIQLENLDRWTEDLSGLQRQALDELGDLLVRQHQVARVALLQALDSRRYERLVAALTGMLDRGPLRRAPGTQLAALAALPELIDARHKDAQKAARRAKRTGLVTDFHRLRIRCKRLRYAIEFTGDLYGGDVKRYARRIAALQDSLGLIQDAEAAATRLKALALGEDGASLSRATVFAMGMVAQRCEAEAATLLAKLPAVKHVVNDRLWAKAVEIMTERKEEAERAAASAAELGGRHGLARPASPAVPALPPLGVTPGTVRARRAGAAVAERSQHREDTTVTPIRRGIGPA